MGDCPVYSPFKTNKQVVVITKLVIEIDDGWI